MTSFSPLSLRNVLIAATVLRISLILYSEWHDARSLVKYTDVDYRVFGDAATFLLQSGPGDANQAQGPLKRLFGYQLNAGDPYTRETYRYTPLLAILLTPNVWLHPSFGKYLFSACDIINGMLIYQLLKTEILPRTLSLTSSKTKRGKRRTKTRAMSINKLATIYSTTYLLNPLIFSISTRGSSESVLTLFVLLSLYASLKGWWDLSAVLLGLSTHWKIYPIIYGIGCLGVLGDSSRDRSNYLKTIVNTKTIRFTTISALTFLLLGAGCYAIWGYPFLYETYLYHLHRLDHRHNFSPYFYLTYLTYPSIDPATFEPLASWSRILRSPLTSFVPQMTLTLGLGLIFGRRKEDLVFTWFSQTVVFVVFNKVCTSQYFPWYLFLLPLLLPRLSLSRSQALMCVGVWITTQALWLSEAYKLEFLGQNAFFGLWMRGLIYVIGNCWVLVKIMGAYDRNVV